MKKIQIKILFFIFFFLCFMGNVKAETVQKIPLIKENIIDETISVPVRPGYYLIDEQEMLPNLPEDLLKENNIMNSKETWYPSSFEKTSAMILDLKAEFKITHIAIRVVTGGNTITFSSGKLFQWQEMFKRTLDKKEEWILVPVDVETRYLHMTASTADSGISEILLYGYQTGEKEPKKEPAKFETTSTVIQKFVGMNAFIDDPLDVLRTSGTIREYHNMSWTLNQKNQSQFSPGSWWDFDAYYKMLNQANIDVIPCIQGNASFMLGYNGSSQIKPITKTANATDPKSYREHASGLYQYAARYGSSKVSDNKLFLKSNQARLSGLNYLNYYENWNEPDKTWERREGYFHPYEFAAMTSADYDGHQKTLGDTYGIKNADPNAKLVLGGVAGGKNYPQYLELMKLWFQENRTDGILPFDVINYHYYAGKQNPENSDFLEVAKGIVDWKNTNAPDKEIWLTEFGWDTNAKSPLGVISEDQQRDYLIRTYLLSLRAGIDRATMYMVRDTGASSNTGKYGTSGLTTQKGQWNKKSSWYGLLTMRNTLEDYVFSRIIKEDKDIYIYEFIKPNTNEMAYALWSPTGDNSKILNYNFEIGNQENVNVIRMEKGNENGFKNALEINDGIVQVNVTESPIFVTSTKVIPKPVIKDQLKLFLEQNASLKEDEYTIESFQNWKNKYTEGIAILENAASSQEEVDLILKELQATFKELVKKPIIPEEPSEPEVPEKPETPEEPSEPEVPEKPETPEEPSEPEVPEKPETPEEPSKPEVPEKPETPESPSKPEVPEKPETPEEPSKPEVPKDSTTNDTEVKPPITKPKEPNKPVITEKPNDSKNEEILDNNESNEIEKDLLLEVNQKMEENLEITKKINVWQNIILTGIVLLGMIGILVVLKK